MVGPNTFSQPRDFDLLQDDFLDLADDTHHVQAAEMALCLSPQGSSATTTVQMTCHPKTVTASDDLQQVNQLVDNPVMKLDNLDSWDQDVLLSNAVLPETNPLLLDEDLDPSMGEDFQKMLNDWENHIGSLQTSELPDVDLNASSSSASENNVNSNGVTSTSVANSNTIPMSTSNVMIKNEYTDYETIEPNPIVKPVVHQLSTSEQANGRAKMTLGQMALAGIVISSGPGDHFETYEVASSHANPQHCNLNPSTTPAKSRPTIVPLRSEFELRSQSVSRKTKQSSNLSAVLEATDAENLLDQFEDVTEDFDCSVEGGDNDNIADPLENNNLEEESKTTNPKKTSNIFKAVQNHFAASAASTSTGGGSRDNPTRKLPRIVPSQRIKEALPREIIERIKASSQKSRTIAIIEPVTNNPEIKKEKTEKPAIISKSHVIQPQHHTRFAEAASSLNKSKHLRLISASSNPQQVQISLDHDYCSSSAKIKRGQRLNHVITTSTSSMTMTSNNRPVIRLQPATSMVKPSSIVVSSPMTSKSIVRVNPEAIITMPIAVEVNNAGGQMSSPLSSPARKDSGLESGEASDTSESQHNSTASSSPSDLYSKVPNYLTSVSVTNNDSRSVTEQEENKSYDRLPAYVKGVPKRVSNNGSTDSEHSRMRTRGMRSRSSSSNSSIGDHSSTEAMVQVKAEPSSSSIVVSSRMTTRSRTSVLTSNSPGSNNRRRRHESSSSSSSSSDNLPSPRQKKRRTWRKPPVQVGNQGSSTERSRSPLRWQQTSSKQQKPVEERRVMYVGRICEGTSRADLRKRFQVFGPIEEISVHFRDRGDNYGFVTFQSKSDAFSAIEHGNDDTSYPKVDLCFGGRRAFCKERYADLDSGGIRNKGYIDASSTKPIKTEGTDDFDFLLQQARAGIVRK